MKFLGQTLYTNRVGLSEKFRIPKVFTFDKIGPDYLAAGARIPLGS